MHNVTFTYTGSGINTGPIQGGGDIILSGFWAVSSSNELAVTHFSAGDNRLNLRVRARMVAPCSDLRVAAMIQLCLSRCPWRFSAVA